MQMSKQITKSEAVDQIFSMFESYGHGDYDGEAVTLNEHLLQAAYAAEQAGEDDIMVAACLLHDYGDFILRMNGRINDHSVDTRHEHLGANALRRFFGPEVTELVRSHVLAKCYLCHQEGYERVLSPISQISLQHQGGPLTGADAAAFERSEWFERALQLHRYDDSAKKAGMVTPHREHYRTMLESLVVTSG